MQKKRNRNIFIAIIAVIVALNAFLLLRNNDVIEKSYYINNIQPAISNEHIKEFHKEGILSAREHVIVAMNVQDVEEIHVKRSETITSEQELAKFKSDAVEIEMQKLEDELDAYETELSELESILSYLEDQADKGSPSIATDSTSVKDNNFWNLDLTLELGIEQGIPTAEGEAILGRHIAETNRQISILNSSIYSLETERALISPVDGIIGDIIQDSDTLTFIIYPEEKSVLVYVDAKQWQNIEVDQQAEIVIRKGADDEFILDGSVIEKQQIPAAQSVWYDEMAKHEKIDPKKTLYEIKVEPTEFLDDYPYGERVDVTITTNEALDSLMVKSDWIVDYEVEDIGEQHIYTIDYDGRTRLIPVDVAFTKKATLEEINARPDKIEEVLDVLLEEPEGEILEGTTEEDIKKIHKVELTKEEEEKEAPKQYDVTVFTGLIDDDTVLLDGTLRNIYAPTFRPYPLQKFEWENIAPISWQEVIPFIFQP